MPWPRCQCHLQQNAPAAVPVSKLRAQVAADLRSVFLAPDGAYAAARLQEIVAAYATTAACAPPTPSNASTPERKRRTRVASLFPNEASLLRLTCAVLAGISDDGLSSKIRLDMNPSTPPAA